MTCKYVRANIGPLKVCHFLKEQFAGCENIGYTRRIYKIIRDWKALIKDIDMHMFTDVLKQKKDVGVGFFIDYQVDEENRLKKVFCISSMSRRSYALFSNILLFDTTHTINRSSIVYAPFIRLNHHK